jgi:hypothetical protein
MVIVPLKQSNKVIYSKHPVTKLPLPVESGGF